MRFLLSLLPLFFLASVLPAASSEKSSLKEALSQASDYQFNFQNKKAIETLETALASFEGSPPTLADLEALDDVYLFMAYCHKNRGNQTEMNKALLTAARLNPTLVADEMLFPPSWAAAFEKAKDTLWSGGEFGALMIQSNPKGAQVFINGAYKGKIPLRLDRYPVGHLHLYLQQGKATAYRKVDLQKGKNPAVTFKMKKPL